MPRHVRSAIAPLMLLLFASGLLAAQPVPDADDDQKPPKARSQPARSRDADDDKEPPKAKPQSATPVDRDDAQPTNAKSSSAKSPEADDQEEEERSQPQSAIVVTARRLDAARTKIDESLGATVYSLSNDAIENRPGGETGSISAILGQTPGVGLSSFGLTIRGSRTIQVRINDVILPEAILDPAEHLTSRLAETTRLITGTLPAQFGFAPAGVISVTTKNGHYDHGGQAEFFADTRGMIEPAFEWAGSTGGSSLFGSGSYERSRDRIEDGLGFSARDVRHELEGLASGDQLIGQNDRISLILGGSRETHRIGETSIVSGTSRNSDGYGVATFQHSAEGLTLHASLFGSASSEKAEFIALSGERRTSAGTQIDASYQLGAMHVLRTGLLLTRSTSRESRDAGMVSDERRTSLGLYLQDEWKIAPGLTFNPGIRSEWLTGLGSRAELEPRANFVWTGPGGLTAHFGYARYAIVAPIGKDQALGQPKPER
ncbi:MAG TPA: TonB-dependent receptor, partial [Sphingomicrobium sp.]|nr:TonB-dependent receptor [Sphingomicrobium sp.]